MAAFRANDLPANATETIYQCVAVAMTDRDEKKMPESKNDFRKALGSVIEARGREATRSVVRAREHLLLGSITKRPN
jgi:hypothetical protein